MNLGMHVTDEFQTSECFEDFLLCIKFLVLPNKIEETKYCSEASITHLGPVMAKYSKVGL